LPDVCPAGEESPDNKEHHTSVEEDIREGMVNREENNCRDKEYLVF